MNVNVLPTIAMRIAVLALSLSFLAGAQSLSAVFSRMDKTAPQFKSVAADLKRDVHTAVVNDDTLEKGTIKVKREKAGETKALIDITAPEPKSVAFDGSNVSVYYPKIKTVQIYDVGTKKGMVDQFLLLGFGATSAELQAAYDISWIGMDDVEGKPASHIQLIPKTKELLQRLKKAELWIGDTNGIPVQERFEFSSNGDFMLVTYLNIKSNPALSDGALKLSTPKGVITERPQL